MAVSILHRVCGNALAFGGVIFFTWWLAAAASGPNAYASFYYYAVHAAPGDSTGFAVNILAKIIAIGLSWAFFQHMFSGLRHFVLDTGAGYELKTNKTYSIATMVGSILATLVVWAYILGAR
jgi:succinate dehydrogenase / fumarate reductase, cytochrome b subunit